MWEQKRDVSKPGEMKRLQYVLLGGEYGIVRDVFRACGSGEVGGIRTVTILMVTEYNVNP
jgi:hypothetical protein